MANINREKHDSDLISINALTIQEGATDSGYELLGKADTDSL